MLTIKGLVIYQSYIFSFFCRLLVLAMPGQSSLTSRVSPPLKLYGDPNTKLKPNWPKSNFEYYHKGRVILITLSR